jgi:hypothetical protein
MLVEFKRDLMLGTVRVVGLLRIWEWALLRVRRRCEYRKAATAAGGVDSLPTGSERTPDRRAK